MPGVRIDNWKGLATAISPYVLAPGATVRQSNLQIKRPGEIRQRPGMEAVYSAVDYAQVLGMYRVTNGVKAADDLILCAKLNDNQTFIRYQSILDSNSENSWVAGPSTTVTTTAEVGPTFAEDRFGRIFVFQGDGASPLVINRSTKLAKTAGLEAPTVAPSVTPSGNGYFIERVDVVSGGGSYWAAPPIIIQAGGARVRDARLKAIVQGGSIVAVDVIDGGSGYQTPPTLVVDESTVKGVGFRGYGVIGVDPGIQGFEPVFTTTGTITHNSNQLTNVSNASLFRTGARVSATGIPSGSTVTNVAGSTVTISNAATVSGGGSTVGATLTVNEGALTAGYNSAKPNCFSTSTSSPSVAYGFGTTVTITGTQMTVTNSVTLNRLQVGAVVEGGTIPAGTTIQAVDVTTGLVTLSAAPTQNYNAGTTPSSLVVAITQAAPATYDSTADRYTALIPLTNTTNVTSGAATSGVGASARVQFSQYTVSLANQITSTTAEDSTWPVKYSTFFGTSTNNLGTPSDYYYNTDDMTVGPNGSTVADAYWAYWFPRNNEDYFAALTPGLTWKFHSRVPRALQWTSTTTTIVNGSTFQQKNYSYIYADAYLLDFGSISLRYYTGSRAELETGTDVESKWVWVTVPVQVNAVGRPFIDVELQPAKKTSTTDYVQYSGFQKPTVRFYLTYCPSSWVSTVGDNEVNVGWRRSNAGTRSQDATTNTHKGWWCAGAATTGVSSKPIVDFAQGSLANSAAGINASTCEVRVSGAGMEQGTFFAVQFDQVNAALPAFGAYGNAYWQTNNGTTSTNGTKYTPATGNPASAPADYSTLDKNPVSPAWNDEYNSVINPSRLTKSFSQYRVRFYFWANTVVSGQLGPPGNVVGKPSVDVVGSGYKTGDRGEFTLRQRSDLTATAAFANGDKYTFTAQKITDPSATNTIASVVVSSGGTNYYGSPKLKYTGTGFGLSMDAVVSGGAITSVNVQSGGGGFTTSPLVYADSETAQLIPVMRPAMRGTYRCAYRYADWSLTEVGQVQVTTVAGSVNATVDSAAAIDTDFVIESNNTQFMSRVVSKTATAITLSRPATATGTATAIVRDMTKPIAYSNFSPIVDVDTTTFAAVPNPTAMVWSLPSVQPPSRATIVEFYRTSGDESLVFYRLEQYGKVSGNSVSIVGTDTMTDEDLFNPSRPFYAALPVVLPNGGLNAFRFGVPRSDMHVCAAYGDRLWYGVSTSGQNSNSVFFSVYDEFESCPPEYEIAIQNNQKSTDSLTGLVPFGNYLLCMQNAHCYGLSYNTSPDVDASVQLLANRGMLAQSCHDLFDDNIYVMDERGIYVMDRSGNVQSLSDQIRNWFDNGLLDLTYRRRFFVKVDQRNSVLRAFVVTKGSGATSPNMAFCYHVDLKVWWTESWPNGLTCAVDFRKSFLEQDQPIYGAVDGDIYRAGGLTDYSYRALRSVTVTNGGSGYTTPPTVTVSAGQSGCGAQFTPVVQNGKVVEILIDEPGFGYGTLTAGVLNQSVSLTISPPASGTTATATAQCDPLTLAPSVYPEFSVFYAVKTGAMELVNDGNANTKDALQDRSVSVIYRPTATNSELCLREYFNNSAQPRSNVMPRDRGTGFVHDTTGAKTKLNMSATRSALGTATGVAKAQFAGRNYSDMGGADRHVAVELSGASVPVLDGGELPSEVLLYGLEVNGVLGGGD